MATPTVNIMSRGTTQSDDWYRIYPSNHLFGIGNIDYSLNPGGYNWYPSNQQAIDPNGTFMVISDTVTDGVAAVGNDIATWHVASGATGNDAVELYKRLQFAGNLPSASNYSDVRRQIKLNYPQVLMYETNFTKDEFNYPVPQNLKYNFDFGNLNSDIKHPLESRMWNMSAVTGATLNVNAQWTQPAVTGGTLNGAYRTFDGLTYSKQYLYEFSSNVTNFGIVEGMCVSMRFKINGGKTKSHLICEIGGVFQLNLFSNGQLALKYDDNMSTQGTLINNSLNWLPAGSAWNTVTFGFDIVSDQIFLCVSNNTLGQPDIQFVSGHFATGNNWGQILAKFFYLDGAVIDFGSLQIWSGISAMANKNSINTIDPIYAHRWI